MKIELDVTGLENVVAAMNRVAREKVAAHVMAGRAEAEAIKAASMEDTPVLTGNLRASHYIREQTTSGGGMDYRIGAAADYAAPVHNIPRPHKVGKWRFLADALDKAEEGMVGRMADRVKKAGG